MLERPALPHGTLLGRTRCCVRANSVFEDRLRRYPCYNGIRLMAVSGNQGDARGTPGAHAEARSSKASVVGCLAMSKLSLHAWLGEARSGWGVDGRRLWGFTAEPSASSGERSGHGHGAGLSGLERGSGQARAQASASASATAASGLSTALSRE